MKKYRLLTGQLILIFRLDSLKQMSELERRNNMDQITSIITSSAMSILVVLTGIVVQAVKKYLLMRGRDRRDLGEERGQRYRASRWQVGYPRQRQTRAR